MQFLTNALHSLIVSICKGIWDDVDDDVYIVTGPKEWTNFFSCCGFDVFKGLQCSLLGIRRLPYRTNTDERLSVWASDTQEDWGTSQSQTQIQPTSQVCSVSGYDCVVFIFVSFVFSSCCASSFGFEMRFAWLFPYIWIRSTIKLRKFVHEYCEECANMIELKENI